MESLTPAAKRQKTLTHRPAGYKKGPMAPKDIGPLLPQLLSFPPHPPPAIPLTAAAYDKEIKHLRKALNGIPNHLLIGGVPNGGDLLEILDPSINTLPYLFVLLGHFYASRQKSTVLGSPLWIKALGFFDRFDPVQIRYVGTEFRGLIGCIGDVALASQTPIAAIRPIRTAILRLDPSASCFTSTHLVFVRLCLEARTFRAAKAVLDQNIYEFPSTYAAIVSGDRFLCSEHDTSSGFITNQSELSDKLTYRDPLSYFLYGASIYMALQEWDRAISFLELLLTAPTKNNPSQLQVEAYKKWILAHLYAHGVVPSSLPKTTRSQVAKVVRVMGKPYEALGDVFKDGLDKELDVRRLNAEIQAGNWDTNLSIVNGVLDAYRQFSISKLGSTYAALPLPEISKRTSPTPDDHAETAQYITTMIQKGRLNATLEKRSNDVQSWVLRFASTGAESLSEEEQHAELTRQATKTAELAGHVRSTERKLFLSKEYADSIRRSRNHAQGAQRPDELQEWLAAPPAIDDEDIMDDA
ncbi:MAG: hypothetical protein L6R37_004733 [Teloschistes peruensis]|nr:MAG: hypothetical protein L6R37_004733 [Teloschistes peruensis]